MNFSTIKHLSNNTLPKKVLKKNISLPLINVSKSNYENKYSFSSTKDNKKTINFFDFPKKKKHEGIIKNFLIIQKPKKYNYQHILPLYNMAKFG